MPESQSAREMPLRIQVDHKYPLTACDECRTEIVRDRRLTDAALLIDDRDDPCFLPHSVRSVKEDICPLGHHEIMRCALSANPVRGWQVSRTLDTAGEVTGSTYE